GSLGLSPARQPLGSAQDDYLCLWLDAGELSGLCGLPGSCCGAGIAVGGRVAGIVCRRVGHVVSRDDHAGLGAGSRTLGAGGFLAGVLSDGYLFPGQWLVRALGLRAACAYGGRDAVGRICQPCSLALAAKACRSGRFIARTDVWHSVLDRKSTRLNSSHVKISYAVF